MFGRLLRNTFAALAMAAVVAPTHATSDDDSEGSANSTSLTSEYCARPAGGQA